MFRQLVNNAFQRRNFLCFLDHSSLFRFISTDSPTPKNSFTVSYLINSCGLSQQRAITISEKLQFESSTNPDSVLNLLRDNGFSKTHISKTISQRPRLLVSNVDKTLKPKFDFFNSKGLSGEDLAKVLSREVTVLDGNLEKTIIPTFDFLKSIVETDEKVIVIFKRSMGVRSRIKTVQSNIKILRSYGVPMYNIRKLLVSQPRVFSTSASRFGEKVEEVRKMKFCPSQYMFLVAMHALSAMRRSNLEAKFDVYKRWGWSEDQVQCVFRKFPQCMMLSEENIMYTMDIFVNKFGYAPSSVAEQPVVLNLSCERRIIPRCAAIQILVKNGKVEPSTTLSSFLILSEDVFLRKYIQKFEREVPELLRAYQGEGNLLS